MILPVKIRERGALGIWWLGKQGPILLLKLARSEVNCFRRHTKATQKQCIQKHLEITAHTMRMIHGTLITTNVKEYEAELSSSKKYTLYILSK